jgi:DNA-binding LacI/PurR family transcriptional regulator
VRQAIAFLDYRPNQFASALMTRSSRVIGLVVPDDFAGMKPEVLAQTEAEARRLGFHLLLVSASRLAETDDTRAAPALGMIDAVAVLIARPAPELHLALQSLGVPMAFLQPHDPAKRQAEPTLQSAAELVRRAMHAVLDPA